eukprot:COSAG02_NODE_2000_length_10140_cov_14.090429_7_plen_88_part_00
MYHVARTDENSNYPHFDLEHRHDAFRAIPVLKNESLVQGTSLQLPVEVVRRPRNHIVMPGGGTMHLRAARARRPRPIAISLCVVAER